MTCWCDAGCDSSFGASDSPSELRSGDPGSVGDRERSGQEWLQVCGGQFDRLGWRRVPHWEPEE